MRTGSSANSGRGWRIFDLDLHPDKTRLIEFGRFAFERRAAKGLGRPETFDFLGSTHICAKAGDERFLLMRLTI